MGIPGDPRNPKWNAEARRHARYKEEGNVVAHFFEGVLPSLAIAAGLTAYGVSRIQRNARKRSG
jgi:hypothetical protein